MPRDQLIIIREGTAAAWAAANPVLAQGEMGVATDTGNHKTGDGATAWNGLPWAVNYADTVATVTATQALTAAAPYSAQRVVVDAAGGQVTLTLPDATGCKGQPYHVRKSLADTSTNAVLITTTAGQTIDGVATVGFVYAGHFIELYSDGANWQIAQRTTSLFRNSIGLAGGGHARRFTVSTTAPTSPAPVNNDFYFNTSNLNLYQYQAGVWTVVGTWPSGTDYYALPLDMFAGLTSPTGAPVTAAAYDAAFVCPPSGQVFVRCGVQAMASSFPGWFALLDTGNSSYITNSQTSCIPPGLSNMGHFELAMTASQVNISGTPTNLVPGQVYTWRACWKPGNGGTPGAGLWTLIDNSPSFYSIDIA